MGVVSDVIKTLKKGISGGKAAFNSAYGYYNHPNMRDKLCFIGSFSNLLEQ